jgi:hypothetical protein
LRHDARHTSAIVRRNKFAMAAAKKRSRRRAPSPLSQIEKV